LFRLPDHTKQPHLKSPSRHTNRINGNRLSFRDEIKNPFFAFYRKKLWKFFGRNFVMTSRRWQHVYTFKNKFFIAFSFEFSILGNFFFVLFGLNVTTVHWINFKVIYMRERRLISPAKSQLLILSTVSISSLIFWYKFQDLTNVLSRKKPYGKSRIFLLQGNETVWKIYAHVSCKREKAKARREIEVKIECLSEIHFEQDSSINTLFYLFCLFFYFCWFSAIRLMWRVAYLLLLVIFKSFEMKLLLLSICWWSSTKQIVFFG
jgi:hypothetical protein